MKTQNIIRLLAGLSLLILFCPFFEMCSFRREEANEVETEISEVQSDTGDLKHSHLTNTAEIKGQPEESKADSRTAIEKRHTIDISGWEFATIPFEDFPDNLFNFFLFFTGCAISSIMSLVFAITRKLKLINIMAWISGSLALLPLLITVVMDGNINIVSDIRYGYLLYIINSIAIIVFSKKAIKQNAI
ncbi:hypothetical protein AAEO56_02415 [Flavobacterium sp. DGU11]|uniref:Uncharacterized protein n=1 Tax=Flavobacterium arundinis TaxID=3139143 RepID=A0ABU9HT44_9FLAO